MSISKMIAANMLQYKLAHELTTVELAEELHPAVSTTQEYLNGDGDSRTDTLEMIARQMGISVAQLISSCDFEPVRFIDRAELGRSEATLKKREADNETD